MLKKHLSILLAALGLGSRSLFALVHPHADQCEPWGLQGEYLFWLPDIDNSFFVVDGTLPPDDTRIDGTIKNNSFGFQSGFRIEGAYAFNSLSDFHIRYARLNTRKERTVSGNSLSQVEGGFNELVDVDAYTGYATSDLTFKFQNVEILFSRKFADNCDSSQFYLFGGLQYFYFKSKESYTYVEIVGTLDSAFVTRAGRNDSIGPEFGLEFVIPLNLLNCDSKNHLLSIVGQASGTLLVNRSLSKYSSTQNIIPWQKSHTRSNWRIVPAWNARAGLRYASICNRMNYNIEIGYEFNAYLRALSRLDNPTGDGVYLTQYVNVDLQGLYVALGLTF